MSYHGCGFRNRYGTNKLIDFYNGERCIRCYATSYRCWQPTSAGKILERRPYPARYALKVHSQV